MADIITTDEAAPARWVAEQRGARFQLWWRRQGWRHFVAILASLFALFPIVWIVSASFNAIDNLGAARLIPTRFTLENFSSLFSNATSPVDVWLFNSFKVAVVASLLGVLVSAMAAYAFSRLKFYGRRGLLTSLLVLQIFPQFLGFVALFALAQQFGAVFPAFGLNTHAFLILVYLGGAAGFNAFLLKGFLDSIPASLDEAAVIDGAGQAAIFFRIILPLTRPILAVIFIITFVSIFNEYLLALVLLSSTEQFTLPVGLQAFLQEDYAAKWGTLAATALIGSLPIVAVFLIAQKQIIGGLTQGAVKS